jgi:hypothetical protein
MYTVRSGGNSGLKEVAVFVAVYNTKYLYANVQFNCHVKYNVEQRLPYITIFP